jgi:flagellar biosynthesis/type III secretory pathway chaperone
MSIMKLKPNSIHIFFYAEKVVLLQTLDKQGRVICCIENMISITKPRIRYKTSL